MDDCPKTEFNTNLTGTGTVPNNQNWQYCYNRLPCGVCRLTNCICPMTGTTIAPSWDITCNTSETR